MEAGYTGTRCGKDRSSIESDRVGRLVIPRLTAQFVWHAAPARENHSVLTTVLGSPAAGWSLNKNKTPLGLVIPDGPPPCHSQLLVEHEPNDGTYDLVHTRQGQVQCDTAFMIHW